MAMSAHRAEDDRLPQPYTPFIGRSAELAALSGLLKRSRLVSLTGPGGCGKTRLAIEVCGDVAVQRLYADGVIWCDLVTLSEPAYVPQRLLVQLGVSEQTRRSPLDALTELIASRQMLLVLDNCEHLLAACAGLARTVLQACPYTTILSTSIMPLGLPAETVWPVPPLSLPVLSPEFPVLSQKVGTQDFTPAPPEAGAQSARQGHGLSTSPLARAERGAAQSVAAKGMDLLRSDAVRLFVERAQLASPSFSLQSENALAVCAICRRLDGMPLALELAAARVKLLSPAQIAERLDDAISLLTRGVTDSLPRHQTLRATMDWSYALLSEAEQRLFRHLSVFAGSFTLEMAETITKDEGKTPSDAGRTAGMRAEETTANTIHPSSVIRHPSDVLDVLSDLVDKSLVTILQRDAQGSARFRLLETIRQYAREKLERSGETIRARERLLEWAVRLAEQAEPHLKSNDAVEWMGRLEMNLDNLRGALHSVRATERLDLGLRLAGALWRFWDRAGYWAEGLASCAELFAYGEQARSRGEPVVAPVQWAWALHTAGRLAIKLRDLHGERYARESLELLRQSGERRGEANAFELLTRFHALRTNEAATRELTQQALALFRAVDDAAGMARALNNLGVAAYGEGEFRAAQRYFEESLAIERRLDAHPSLQIGNLAGVLMICGDYARARELLEEGLAFAKRMSDNDSQVFVLGNLSETALNQGDLPRAEAYAREVLALAERISAVNYTGVGLTNLGYVALVRGALAEARTCFEEGRRRAQQARAEREIANAENGAGLVDLSEGRFQEAATHFRQAITNFQRAQLSAESLSALENLAMALARQGEPRRAARWLALTTALRDRLGTPIAPINRVRHAQTVEALRVVLGTDTFAALQTEARGQTMEEALAEALGEERPAEPAPLHAPAPEPALKVYALGPASVIVGERALASSDWVYHKSKELLFYLLAHPPASKAQIGLDLWPDASPEQLRNNFHRALHYLRKALGRSEWIVYAGNTYTFARGPHCWSDLHEFESRLKEARTLLGAGPVNRGQARQRLTEAVALWRGDFLADMDVGEWGVLYREGLHTAYTQALVDLGQAHFGEACYAEALEVYQRVLAQDEYFEAAHRELMRCYARLGETSRALRHFHALSKLLQDELGASPSPETLLLYERLRRGDDV